MLPPSLPRSLLIAGSGAIGIEFASFYRALGVEVTVVEMLPEILPAEDAEIAALARKAFEKAGIRIITGAKVGVVKRGKDGMTATVEHGDGKRETHRGRADDLRRRRRRQRRGARARGAGRQARRGA